MTSNQDKIKFPNCRSTCKATAKGAVNISRVMYEKVCADITKKLVKEGLDPSLANELTEAAIKDFLKNNPEIISNPKIIQNFANAKLSILIQKGTQKTADYGVIKVGAFCSKVNTAVTNNAVKPILVKFFPSCVGNATKITKAANPIGIGIHIAFHVVDIARSEKHERKEKTVKAAVDVSATTTGAVLGSLFLPGPGSLIGALAGSVTGTVLNSAFSS